MRKPRTVNTFLSQIRRRIRFSILMPAAAVLLLLHVPSGMQAEDLSDLIEEESETGSIFGSSIPEDGLIISAAEVPAEGLIVSALGDPADGSIDSAADIPAEEPIVPGTENPAGGLTVTAVKDPAKGPIVPGPEDTAEGVTVTAAKNAQEGAIVSAVRDENKKIWLNDMGSILKEGGRLTKNAASAIEKVLAQRPAAENTDWMDYCIRLLCQVHFDGDFIREAVSQITNGINAYFRETGRMWQDQKDTTWSIRVNLTTNTVTVYRGEVAVKAFACSIGLNEGSTPQGNYQLKDKLRWHELVGPSWGQWCSHITGDILFHSLPYNRANDNFSLDAYDYNQIGTSASHGCIRLTAANAKYLFDNCPVGTGVCIFAGTKEDDPLGKPMPVFAGKWTGTYDPTDITIAQDGRISDERWEAWSGPMGEVLALNGRQQDPWFW